MFAVLSILLQSAAPAAPPLQPNGAWTVAYEESMCLAARKFGADGEVAVGFRPPPLEGGKLEISVDVSKWPSRLHRDGDAVLTVEPGARRFEAQYRASGRSQSAVNALVLTAEPAVFDSLADNDVLSIRPHPGGAVSVRLSHVAKVRAALADCRTKLLKHWGVDLAALDRIAVPAEPAEDPARWISYMDYPSSALANRRKGTSNIFWTIGLDGRVSGCRIVASSGTPELDIASCRAITARGRFRPARDANGRPVVSWASRRVRWWTSD